MPMSTHPTVSIAGPQVPELPRTLADTGFDEYPGLTYKGYVGSAELSAEDGLFFGRIRFIRDLVSYEAETARGLVAAFEAAVDEYLADCTAEGRAPDAPFKGSFNIRTGAPLHRRLALSALERGVSLNELVARTLEQAFPERSE